jgi:hypothetical protein
VFDPSVWILDTPEWAPMEEIHVEASSFFFFLAVLGFELRASHWLGMLDRRSYHLSHSNNPFFVKDFFQDRVT